MISIEDAIQYTSILLKWRLFTLRTHTQSLNLLNFEDGLIPFRGCEDQGRLIGDSFYKAFGMLYVNYSWSRTFGKVQDFKDKQRLSLTNVDED